jgi:signal transduction histidine kinase/DNA-binding LacI/PurR family transcriptional regulator/AraC-like DNA-binding protein/response regulator of citrate/malate metabolism
MTDSPQKRLTIGVILDNLIGDSRSSLWPGIADTIQAQGSNLICFSGGYLNDPHDFAKRGNIIYEMIDKNALDGLIIWTSSLSSYVGQASIRRFCERYRPLPMVSIGVVLDGIPSIILDSYSGMRKILTHLITVHARRRIVFIRGPEGHRDAEERYCAYLDVLKEYDLPVVPEWISPPYNWFDPGGKQMMQTLFEHHRVNFDAVVGVNDTMAIGAMEYLQARGINVPEDVSVAGFDNSPSSRVVTPLLTTVPWQMYERGRQAANLMLALLAGEPVPAQILLPSRLIVRQSCGCQDPAITQAKVAIPPAIVNPTINRAQCLSVLEQTIEEKERPPESLVEFLDAFLDELQENTPNIFLPTLERILNQVVTIGGDIWAWQLAVSELRHHLLPALLNDQSKRIRAEDLWHQARVMIGERSRRNRAYKEWQARQETLRLRRINHGLTMTENIPALMNVLAEELPQLGISSCHLALYRDAAQSTQDCRLVLAFDETRRIDLGDEGQHISAHTFVMGKDLPDYKPFHILVMPLYFQDEQLGLVRFKQRPVSEIYEVLREEISTALKGIQLAEENARLYQHALQAEREAQVGRQLAEQADHLKSNFLSMVSHELLTPLVLLVGLSEMMLRKGTSNHFPLPEPYRSDLARIHLSAQYLGNLVRDVLDLARSQMGQLKLVKKPFDLRETLQTVVLVGEQMAREKGLNWLVQIPEQLPKVYGDASRLHQVALNLVTNAVKFTSRGYVKLDVQVQDETITVSVSDSGLGVPLDEQETIFDEFRQSERTMARGYGGLGIGLAICRQLVELHGGQIGIRSSGEENSGSTFYFTLPVLREQLPEQLSHKPNTDLVLVLSQPSTQSARLQNYLTNEGFRVQVLGSVEGDNWLSQVLTWAPGAIVLDSQLVLERGWQLIETLKDNPLTQDIPILFYALPEADTGAMLTLDYLTKPMDTAMLAQTLQRYGLKLDRCDAQQVILVVDDDSAILELHTRIIQDFLPNCRVLQASNGRIALELMTRETPSLVLLDWMMPEMDGMSVLAAMQENERLRGVPVIVLTAQSLTQKEMTHLNQSVAAVLHKGLFSADETLAHIKQTLMRDKRLGNETRRTVHKTMAFIHEHYAESISREEMASFVGVSARHLTRCFHQEVGISPITYLNRYRVKQAKKLLQAGEQNITQVAEAVGFSSSNYFTDAFRRETGMSPRDYQRRKNT